MEKGSKPSLHHIHVHTHITPTPSYIYIYVCIHKYPIAQTIQNAEAKWMSVTIEMYLCEWFSITREKWRSEGIWNLSNKFHSLPYFIFRQKHFLQRPTVSKVVLSTVVFQAVFGILFSDYVYICVLECVFVSLPCISHVVSLAFLFFISFFLTTQWLKTKNAVAWKLRCAFRIY